MDSGTGSFSTSEPIARVVIARSSDQFPLKLAVVDAMNPPTQSVTVAQADEAITDSCWTFYQSFASQPFSPVALQFNDLILNNSDPSQLNTQVAAFFSQNGYPGCDFGTFSIVSLLGDELPLRLPGQLLLLPADDRELAVHPAHRGGRDAGDLGRHRHLHPDRRQPAPR